MGARVGGGCDLLQRTSFVGSLSPPEESLEEATQPGRQLVMDSLSTSTPHTPAFPHHYWVWVNMTFWEQASPS